MDSYPMAPLPAMGSSSSVQGSFNELSPSLSDPSSYPSASKDDAIDGGRRVATVLIGVMILLGIIIIAVMVMALAGGSRSIDKTTWNDEQPDITEKSVRGGNGLTVIVPEFRVPSTPPPRTLPTLTTRSTTQASTEEEVSEAITEKDTEPTFTQEITDVDTNPTTTELPTTRAKKDTWAGLICTIGTKLSAPEELPEDLWCNYLFYDSVFKRGAAPFDPGNLDPALSIFMGRLAVFNYTALGISFAYKHTQHLKSELSTKDGATPLVLKHFFDENICNFGILDSPSDGLDKSTLQEMLESLKLVDGFVRSKGGWPKKCRTFVAVPTPDAGLENVYLDIFPKVFTPSVVVILSHYVQGDNTFQDCRVVPPIMLTRPDSLATSGNYKFDMNSAAESIEKLIARGMDAIWALSITMKGRWTKLKTGEPVGFMSECEHDPGAESFGRYADACVDPNFSNGTHYKSGLQGTQYFNKDDGRILSFDNNTDMVQKLCSLRLQHLTFAYGIAAYDVDYEDYSDLCSSVNVLGSFTRVFTLTLLRDYVRIVFNVPKEYRDCLKLAY